ncbi:hypothetical protein [uncultured Sphingomonas sp.]|uniref:hypothetical protein n=1 Tax=uncultured Sphingomonas sp. TaxID=158754 RepID=UPI0035CAE7E6
MVALNWIKGRKARAALIVIAVADLSYFLWCVAANSPSAPVSKLLLPFIMLGAVVLNRTGRQASR